MAPTTALARFADLGELTPTLDAAAEQLGISPTAVEKNYWVSEVPELYFGAGRLPAWEEICGRVAEQHTLL